MPAATYLRDQWMTYAFTTSGMGTRPTAWHCALHTGDPGAAGTANEVAGSGYARINVTALITRTGSTVTNSAGAITFATVITAGYTVTYASLHDAATAGNALYYGALAVSKVLAIGDALVFATNELDLDVI